MYHETKPCLYVTVDDDIKYPPSYVSTLRAQLEAEKGRAVVGIHGSILHRSLRSYRCDREIFSFGMVSIRALLWTCSVPAHDVRHKLPEI